MSWIAVGVAAVGTIGGIISRSNANKKARQQLANRPSYAIDESIKKRLGLAETQYGGRSGAAAAAERNIFQTAANTQANINRAATDVTQAQLGAGQIQGQTNQAFNQLQIQEIADEQRKLQNLVSAQEAMAAENKAAWGWNVQGKWQDTNAIEAAIAQNRANSWKDVTQAGMAAASLSANMKSSPTSKTTTQATTGYTPGMGAKGITPYTATGNTGVQDMFKTQSPYSWMPNSSLSMGSNTTLPYLWMQKGMLTGNQGTSSSFGGNV
jgi:hypothetical protein